MINSDQNKVNQNKQAVPAQADKSGKPGVPGTAEAAKSQPLQPAEKPDESLLESMGKAVSAPVRDAAADEDRKQTGQKPGR